jgi:hypothetical protein
MPGCKTAGTMSAFAVMEVFSQIYFFLQKILTSVQPKRFKHYSIQLPNIYPTKISFRIGRIAWCVPPSAVATDSNLKMWKRSAKTGTLCVGVNSSCVIIYKTPFTVSSYAFRVQEWSDLVRYYVLGLRERQPLVSFLTGSFVAWHTYSFNGGVSKKLWNVCKFLPNYTVLQSTRRPTSFLPRWESQTLLYRTQVQKTNFNSRK